MPNNECCVSFLRPFPHEIYAPCWLVCGHEVRVSGVQGKRRQWAWREGVGNGPSDDGS